MGKNIVYAVHPSIRHLQAMTVNLEKNSGRSLPQWLALVRLQKLADTSAIRAWLKQQYGLGASSCMLIADALLDPDALDPQAYLRAAPGYVDVLFDGPKAALRPLYEELLGLALELGADVKASPCKTFVPLYRKHVFAQLRPAARTRLDLGLALGATTAEGRLIDTGGFARKDRITHRIAITAAADIDGETKAWLKRAYTMDAA